MDDRAAVMLRDLDRRVRGGSGRAADQQRHLETTALHFLGDVYHLVERGGDQTGQADHVRADFDGLVEDLVAGDHDAHVGDFEAVAGEHDADDVLADVVDVALDGGDEEPAGRTLVRIGGFFRLHVRLEPGDGLLHHAGGFDHLRQEHLARTEQIADDAHAIHQRSFDHLERTTVFREGGFGVLIDELVDALEQGVFEAFLDGIVAPREVLLDLLAALALVAFGQFEQALGGVGPAVEQDVLDVLQQFLGDLVIDLEHAGVDDAHVHAGEAGVIEEGRVHGLAHHVVAPERERDVGNAAGNLGAGEVLFDPTGGVDEIERVVVVLLDAGGDGEDVGVEDDVVRIESDLIDEDAVSAFADADFLIIAGGLAVFIEGHDHHGGAVFHDVARLFPEVLLAFLERDRVDDAFSLQVLKALLEDFPL